MLKATHARASVLAAALGLSLALAPHEACAQAATEPPQTRPPDTTYVDPPPISPGNAFLRAILVPGWGHASLQAYTRGGFYFLTEAATAWMLVRTSRRKSAASALRSARVREVEAEAMRDGITDPIEIFNLIDADTGVLEADALIDSREQQFEDWLALGIFLVLLSGADAIVSAHLYDFPEPLGLQVFPMDDGGVGVGVSIPVGGR